jgi:RHS repeat-associated protein
MLTNVGGSAYTYDAAGNLLSGGGRQYSWNHVNKLSRIRGADGVTEYYRYDPDGNRSERIRGAQRIIYTPDGAEIEGNVRRITHRFNGQPVLQRTYTGTTLTASTYLHSDHLGSIAASSDGSGGSLQRQWFDPWGAMWSGGVNATTRNDTGQHRDGTGLLFYNARYYDPLLARFVSADWIVPHADALTVNPFGSMAEQRFGTQSHGPRNPQDLNRYAYAYNNPVRFNDPSGHLPFLVLLPVAITITKVVVKMAAAHLARRAVVAVGTAAFKATMRANQVAGQAAVRAQPFVREGLTTGVINGAASGIDEGARTAATGGPPRNVIRSTAQGFATGFAGGAFGRGFGTGVTAAVVSSGTTGILEYGIANGARWNPKDAASIGTTAAMCATTDVYRSALMPNATTGMGIGMGIAAYSISGLIGMAAGETVEPTNP